MTERLNNNNIIKKISPPGEIQLFYSPLSLSSRGSLAPLGFLL